MNKQIDVGCVVKAIAGRDDGQYFIVIEKINEEYVLIANGKNRTMAKPKKKKIKHLRSIGVKIDSIADKLLDGEKVLDFGVLSAIKECLPKD